MLGMRVTAETYDPRWPQDVERIRHDLEAKILKRAGTIVPGDQYSRGDSLAP